MNIYSVSFILKNAIKCYPKLLKMIVKMNLNHNKIDINKKHGGNVSKAFNITD